MLYDDAERVLEPVVVDELVRGEKQRLVEMVGLGKRLIEEPALDGSQRYGPFDIDLGRHRGGGLDGSIDHRGEVRDGRVLEHVLRRKRETVVTRASHELNRQDRVASDLEEVVVDAGSRDSQNLRPQLGEPDLNGAPRGDALSLTRRIRGRKTLSVDLPVRRQGKGVERNDRRGHHLRRQPFAQVSTERALGRARIPRANVSDESLALPVVAKDDCRFLDARIGGQHVLDLGELDAESSDLHLAIRSAEERHASVRQVVTEIPRSVEASTG